MSVRIAQSCASHIAASHVMASESLSPTGYQHISVGLSCFNAKSGDASRSVFIVCCTALCICTLRLKLGSDVGEARTQLQHLQP